MLADLFPGGDIPRFFERIEIAQGDLSLDRFGLDKSEYDRLADETSHIVHSAAAVRFDIELPEARKINVGGTRGILAFADRCKDLERVDYVGTAFVAGNRKGVIMENELDEGQGHNNTYEVTKMEAEKLIRERMGELPITIFRPSIVICDSRTGRFSHYSAIFRVLGAYLLNNLKVLPGYPSSLMDIVTVDHVASAIYTISKAGNSTGRSFHLTAGVDNMTTLGEIRDLASRYFSREKFALVPPEDFAILSPKIRKRLSEKGGRLLDEIRLYAPYLKSELRFDNSSTLNALRNSGLKVPKVSAYFGKLAKRIMEHCGG